MQEVSSPLPDCPIRDIVLTERDTTGAARTPPSFCSGSPALHCLASRHGLGRKSRRSHECTPDVGFALPPPLSPALAEVPKGTGRNVELKLRLRMWEEGQISEIISKIQGQQHPGPHRRTNRTMQPQTDDQRGKRACALTAANHGKDSWVERRVQLTVGRTGLQPCFHRARALALAESAEAARIDWGGGRCRAARGAMRERGRKKTGIASIPTSNWRP